MSAQPPRSDADHSSPQIPAELPRRDMLATVAGIGGLAALAALTSKAHAGPLNPPAGPIIATGKTIQDAEPRTALTPVPGQPLQIGVPGSYYLTANADDGIQIYGADITLDLNGFTVRPGPNDTCIRQMEATLCHRLRIFNGRIECSNPGNNAIGLSLTFSNNSGCSVEDVEFYGATFPNRPINSAISSNAQFLTIRRCLFWVADGQSIFSTLTASKGAILDRCTFVNMLAAPVLGGNSTVTDCTFLGTGTNSVYTGLVVGGLSTVRCCAFYLARTVITADVACLIEDNLINNCDTAIVAGAYSTIQNNLIDYGNTAINLGGERITVADNRIQRFGTGVSINANSRATIVRNFFSGVTNITSGVTTNSLIGPVVTAANIATATSPFANLSVA